MSVRTMNQLLMAHEKEAAFGSTTATRGLDKPSQQLVPSALDRAVVFVPTEVIAFWTAAVGILKPDTTAARSVLYGIGVFGLVMLVILDAKLRAKEATPSAMLIDPSRTLRALFLATVAFTLYAFASPASPALTLNDNATRMAGLLAILFTAVLYKLAVLWDLAPDTSQAT